uniref:Sulfotransferase domain-containing protein n=1 Tax=Coccolithus braarudii TaxID=221442 RepID=A0A7S0L5L3_9EUKA
MPCSCQRFARHTRLFFIGNLLFVAADTPAPIKRANKAAVSPSMLQTESKSGSQKYFFLHIPKTAGTSLASDLPRAIGLRPCNMLRCSTRQKINLNRRDCDVGGCEGHLPWLMQHLTTPSPPRLITILRRPIDMARSMFAHCERYTEQRYNESWFDFHGWIDTSVSHLKNSHRSEEAQLVTLRDRHGRPLAGHRSLFNFCPYPAHNPQATRLVLHRARDAFTTVWQPSLVDTAVRTVSDAFHVGVTDYYSASLCLLAAKLDIMNLRSNPKLRNCDCRSQEQTPRLGKAPKVVGTLSPRTQTHFHKRISTELSSITLSQVSALNAVDELLYSHALSRLERELRPVNLACLLDVEGWRKEQ